jgi:hypothetical protein
VLPAVRPDAAFLPSVRTSLNHYASSRLRDPSMLMLASGRNAIQTAYPYLRAYEAPHNGLRQHKSGNFPPKTLKNRPKNPNFLQKCGISSASNMLHRINATVDADEQGDKARFRRLVCREHKAGRKTVNNTQYASRDTRYERKFEEFSTKNAGNFGKFSIFSKNFLFLST